MRLPAAGDRPPVAKADPETDVLTIVTDPEPELDTLPQSRPGARAGNRKQLP